MTIGMVSGAHVPRRAAKSHVNLVVHGPRLSLQPPVQRTRCGIERARINESKTALPSSDHGQLWEPDIITDGHGDTAVAGKIHQRHAVAGRQHIALFEFDLARDVDIKQVHLTMRREQLAVGAKHQAGVIVCLCVRRALLNRELGN